MLEQHKDFNVTYKQELNNKGEVTGLRFISMASTKYNDVINTVIDKLKETGGMLPVNVVIEQDADGKTTQRFTVDTTTLHGMLEEALNNCL